MATSSVLTGGRVDASLPDISLPRLDGGEFSLSWTLHIFIDGFYQV